MSKLGWKGTLSIVLARRFYRWHRFPRHGAARRVLWPLFVRNRRQPVWCRLGGSDLDSFNQIFLNQELEPLARLAAARRIIDCGANAGYASIFFLERFPDATLVAVEPDPENVDLAQRNLGCYGDRCRVLRGAVWSRRARLALRVGTVGDGLEWSIQVGRTSQGETASVEAFDLASLFATAGFEQVDLVKIDIEGAETEVFGAGSLDWLHRATAVAVELHNEEAGRVFLSALQAGEWRVASEGEWTFAVRT